jgi:hypothetical protein
LGFIHRAIAKRLTLTISDKRTVGDRAKELLVDPRERIVLDAFVNENLRATLSRLSPEHLPITGGGTAADFAERVAVYEDAVRDLIEMVILLARWGDTEGRLQLEKILLQLTETTRSTNGTLVWLHLRWYPILLLMYAAGISALSANRFDMLGVAVTSRVWGDSGSSDEPLVVAALAPLTNITDQFKALPGHDRDRYPRSEHMFARLRDPLEHLLFLGTRYERFFDRFELLLALAFADSRDPVRQGDVWGPPGRFAYKQRHSHSPMDLLIDEAKVAGGNWPLLGSGLFGGQAERFLKIAESYKQLMRRQVGC